MILGVLYARKLHRDAILPGIVTGFFLFAGYAFQTMGLVWTTPSKSAFITSLAVPLIPFLAPLVYRKGPGKRELLGVLVASAGMVLLTAPARLADINRGDWLSFCCAVSFAAQAIAVSYYSRRGNFETLVFVQMITVTLLAAALCNLVEKPILELNQAVIGAALLTGIFATALAFSVQAWAQRITTVTRVAVIFALEPVFAWIASYLATGETLSLRASLGAVMIVFGILIVELKRGRVEAHPLIQGH